MSINFVPNDRGLAAFLVSSRMQMIMLQAAHNVQAQAQRIAPVKSGTYKQSFHTEPANIYVATKFNHQRRAGAYVYNDAPHARFVEHYAYQNRRRNSLSSLTNDKRKRR